MERWLETE